MSAPENAEKQKEDSGQSSYLLWNIFSIHGNQYLNFSVGSISQARGAKFVTFSGFFCCQNIDIWFGCKSRVCVFLHKLIVLLIYVLSGQAPL